MKLQSTLDFAGSYRLTLWIFPLLALGIVWYVNEMPYFELGLIVPISFFTFNLLVAIFRNEKIFRNLPLLIAHLGVLVFIVLLGLSSLTYLKGTLELTEGEAFNGKLITQKSGLWHPWSLDHFSFINKGFSVDYLPGVHRDKTSNTVEFEDHDGMRKRVIVGDQHPLILGGYRFYTSFNKGFSAMFSWRPEANPAQAVIGSVHFPSYPINEYSQATEWLIPGTDIRVWTLLKSEQDILDEVNSFTLTAPEKHHVVLRIGEQRYTLHQGQSLPIKGGILRYNGLKMWMGYNVFYDWTRPWLLASVLLVILSMAWHFIASWMLTNTHRRSTEQTKEAGNIPC